MDRSAAACELTAPHPLDAAATVADVTVFLRDYAHASLRARERHAAGLRAGLAYGEAAAERLDVFIAAPGAPLVAFIHGGYWRRLDKDDFSFIADGLVPHGISFASINYGLAPHTPLREIVAQCRRAVAWLGDNAGTLGFDRRRISVAGHSAGGHLAAMAAIALPVHSVTTLSGLHDLQPVQASFVNEWLGLDADEARALSPIAYGPAAPCPVYATAGEHESDAFKAQGRALVDAWAAHGSPASYADSPNDNHFTICNRLRDPYDPLTQRMVSLAR